MMMKQNRMILSFDRYFDYWCVPDMGVVVLSDEEGLGGIDDDSEEMSSTYVHFTADLARPRTYTPTKERATDCLIS
jgi:hypothetical protein